MTIYNTQHPVFLKETCVDLPCRIFPLQTSSQEQKVDPGIIHYSSYAGYALSTEFLVSATLLSLVIFVWVFLPTRTQLQKRGSRDFSFVPGISSKYEFVSIYSVPYHNTQKHIEFINPDVK